MTPTIEQISTALIHGYPPLSADEQHLARAVYRLLATGNAATTDAIAAEARWAPDDVDALLDTWWAVVHNADGAVVGFGGLAAEPVTDHRMDFEGIGTAWTWCSYDTLFVAHLLGATARVSSRCPVTGTEVRLTVTPDGVRGVEPADAET